jgi:mannose-6-phosphate isomerase-like protein (cupin superfamily)
MKGFVQDIEGLATRNDEFRKVLYTGKSCQLVLMSLQPQEEIGAEVHKLDQFFQVEEGSGQAVLDGVKTAIRAGLQCWFRLVRGITSSIPAPNR